MSSQFYPISIIDGQQIDRVSRVLADEFESGATATRLLWPANAFKRRVSLSHSGLTRREVEFLEGFQRSVSGRYDSFWYRDNIGRTGNLQVRFATDLQVPRQGGAFNVRVDLAEIAPVVPPPTILDVYQAAGVEPVLWYDPNREAYFIHCSEVFAASEAWDHSANARHATWTGGATRLSNLAAQWQYWSMVGTAYAITPASLGLFTGTMPACTVMVFARAYSSSTRQVIAAHGSYQYNAGLGIQLDPSNYFTPYVAGGSEVWANARHLNSPVNSWRSFASVWPVSNSNLSFYVDASVKPSDSNTRSYSNGRFAIGADTNGANKCTADIGQVLLFNTALSADQVKAVHNLFAYQYGLTLVP
jgi:hypothetical protein